MYKLLSVLALMLALTSHMPHAIAAPACATDAVIGAASFAGGVTAGAFGTIPLLGIGFAFAKMAIPGMLLAPAIYASWIVGFGAVAALIGYGGYKLYQTGGCIAMHY